MKVTKRARHICSEASGVRLTTVFAMHAMSVGCLPGWEPAGRLALSGRPTSANGRLLARTETRTDCSGTRQETGGLRAWQWLLAGACSAFLRLRGKPVRRVHRTSCRSSIQTAEQMMDWRGHNVRSVTCGSCPPDHRPHIVLVHGFGGSIDYWRRTMPALAAAGYTVHAMDLLGLGLSDKPELEYSIELWSEQVADFCAQLEADVVLVGNSFGSLISLVAAKKMAPKGIVMLNCAVGMNNKNMVKSPSMSGLQKWFAGVVLSFVDFLFKSPILDFLFAEFARADTVGGVLQNLYPTNPAAVDAEIVNSFVKPAETPGALQVLRQIYTGDPGPTPMEIAEDKCFDALPIKVIWGDQDTLTPITGAVGSFFTRLAKERDTIDFEIISAGHLPHDENPDAVNKAVVEWLSRQPWQ